MGGTEYPQLDLRESEEMKEDLAYIERPANAIRRSPKAPVLLVRGMPRGPTPA